MSETQDTIEDKREHGGAVHDGLRVQPRARTRHDLSRQDEYCASYYPEHDRLICGAEWFCTVRAALDPWIGMHGH